MSQRTPVLVALAGLPGVGKTTVAKALVLAAGAVYLRVDTVEQAIRNADDRPVETAGYGVVQALAADNLALGQDVVADTVNPLAVTREAFAACARRGGARLIDVEVICSDLAEHRRRVESRASDIVGLAPPSWASVQAHPYAPWTTPRLMLDTARRSVGEAVALLLAQMDG